jgi:hypothetical protein
MTEHDTGLTEEQRHALRCVAGMMIPASTKYDVPGADDDRIFADIVASLGRDAVQVRAALENLDGRAGGRFADAPPDRREEAAAAFRDAGGDEVTALTRVVAQCYYRDDRVMRSLNMEVRPPFPKGFTLETGDWSLLDAVRARPKLWRDAP